MHIEELTKLIKYSITSNKTDGFTGFGVVLVEGDFNALPISPLLGTPNDYLHAKTLGNLNSFLFNMSKFSDIRHDGFHIYSIEKKILAVSQYFSPPINNEIKNVVYNIGARVRTAQYGSLCEGVLGIVSVGNNGKIYQAINGVITKVKY